MAGLAPLGLLEPEWGRRLDRHLRTDCSECTHALQRTWQAIDVLALSTPRVAPSSAARARLMSSIRGEPVERRARGAWPTWLAAAGLAAVTVGLGLTQARQLSAERQARLEAEHQLVELDARRGDLAERSALLEGAVDIVAGPAPQTVALSGESDFSEARVRVLFDPVLQRTVLLARELPPPPPGSTYQLWHVEDGVPKSLGVFSPDALGRALELEPGILGAPGSKIFAVSVEPEGGVAAPTGPIVLSGS